MTRFNLTPKMPNWNQHIPLGGCLFWLLLAVVPVSQAEDIAIYTQAVGAEAEGVINPNVLFIIDSSGSMNDATAAVPVNKPYDPEVDYGENDDYIYVYDGEMDWTGDFFTASQNRCKAIVDKHNSTPSMPIYQGKGMQWREFSYCPGSGGGASATTIFDSGNVDDNEEYYLTEVNVSDLVSGTTIEFEVTNFHDWRDVRYEIKYFDDADGDGNGDWRDLDACEDLRLDGDTTDKCEVDVFADIPNDATKLKGRVYADDSYYDRYTEASFTYNIGSAGGGSAGTTQTASGEVDNNDHYYFDQIPVADLVDGTRATFEVVNNDNSQSIKFEFRYEDDDGDWRDLDACEDQTVENGSTDSCEIDLLDDIPGNAVNIVGRVYATDGGKNRAFDAEINYNIGAAVGGGGAAGGDCAEEDRINGSEWFSAFTSDAADTATILECQGDAGAHGNLNASTEDTGTTNQYITYCPDDDTGCDSPYYVSLSGSQLDWTARGIPVRKFVSGNYHNYLQSDEFVDINNLETGEEYVGAQDKNTYCGDDDENNDFFTDVNDGLIYECQFYIEIARKAAIDVATQQSGVNVGAMRFNHDDGGHVINAVEDVETNLGAFKSKVEAIPAEDWTPLGETYYEAYRYFSGQSPQYGNVSGKDDNAFTNGNYKSPITNECQSNNIIYLSDGDPTQDETADYHIEGLDGIGECGDGNGTSPDTSCLDELAEYMATRDVNSDIDGVNTVSSHFVGFNKSLPIFEAAAEKGKGGYYEATSYDDLLDAFEQILVSIAVDKPTTLVAPAVSVNAFNELQHRDQIYYAIFEPSLSPRWQGNVKKFRIDENGVVRDSVGEAAVSADTGFIKDSSQSFWSDEQDGGDVDAGGFTEQSTNSRNIYLANSVMGAGAGIGKLGSAATLDPAALDVDNGDTDADTAEAARIRDWLLGIDVLDQNNDGQTTDAHKYAADPLHSKPFVITYSGTNEGDARDVLFVTTNLGMLHAIDARTSSGEELWAYMPPELMGNAKEYIDNDPEADHTYGLDGSATVWTIEDTTGDDFSLSHVYMFQGMRRGGSGYFAWDLSNALSATQTPISTMWKIPGGNTTDFVDMGQSWSQMIPTKMSWNCGSEDGCTTREVLVFGGGYDAAHYDDKDATPKTTSEDAASGNAVYIVDAVNGWDPDNGGFIYKIGDGELYDESLPIYNSVPGSPNPVDVDGDGDMDILFFVDIAGHVWRVDFDDMLDKTSDDYTTGGMIADLYNGTDYRRFYNGLDVSLSAPRGSRPYFNLSVGSGYRAHPKHEETATNGLFVIHDFNVQGPLLNDSGVPIYTYHEDGASLSVIEMEDLHVWTTGSPADVSTNARDGYFRAFDGVNEKLLQTSITFNGDVLFSTYIPVGTETAECGSGQIGGGRTYVLDLATGTGNLRFDTDGDGTVDDNDHDTYFDLAHEGIPADGTIIFSSDLYVCFGTECFKDLLDDEVGMAEKTYWREE